MEKALFQWVWWKHEKQGKKKKKKDDYVDVFDDIDMEMMLEDTDDNVMM